MLSGGNYRKGNFNRSAAGYSSWRKPQSCLSRGHPLIKEQQKKIVDTINSFAEETAEVSFVFLGDSIIVEDINVDLSNYPSVQILVKRLKRLHIESMTFDTSCNEMDIVGFLDVVSNPPRDISVYDLSLIHISEPTRPY